MVDHAKRRRIIKIIGDHGHRMSDEQLDKALGTFASLMKSNSSELTIDTTEEDRKWKARLRREDRNTHRNDNADKKPDDKPTDKPNEKLVDIGKNKDHKPVSLNKYKVRMPNGRTILYVVNDNGSLSHKWVDDYIPTLKEVPELHHEHVAQMHEHIQADKESQKDDKKMAKSERRWGQSQRGFYDPLRQGTAQPAPELPKTAPPPPSVNLGSAGHIASAKKHGVDISRLQPGDDLTRMTPADFRRIAIAQTQADIAHVTAAHAKIGRR